MTEGATALKPETEVLYARTTISEAAKVTVKGRSTADRVAEAKLRGYEGTSCPECAQFHDGAERDLLEVRHVRLHERVLLNPMIRRSDIESDLIFGLRPDDRLCGRYVIGPQRSPRIGKNLSTCQGRGGP